MKLLLICVLTMLSLGCGSKRSLVADLRANNGHSLVTSLASASELECSSGGNRLDVFLDLDYSLMPSAADIYMNSLVACNGALGMSGTTGEPGPTGAIGPAGPAGEPGPAGLDGTSATISTYSGTNCTLISNTSTFIKKSGSNYGLYTASNCSSNSKFAEVSQGESYWASASDLAVWSSTSLRVISFFGGAQ